MRHAAACADGLAEGFACSQVDLAAHVDLAALGATPQQEGNDIWGWTDAMTGREYALIGVGNGTAFVDVTLPTEPVVLGLLPTHSVNSLWRDIKVHADHAYIVSEASGHGMQVFDLTRLRGLAGPPVTFTADAHYAGIGRAHNIVINEETGYGYAVGSRQGSPACAGGLHIIDLAVPLAPSFSACFSADGYTHDAQCVIYDGPDVRYQGREICFNSNEDTLTIVDVTSKAAPVQIARVGYVGSSYAHQGWLTPDHRWFLMNDELDELNNNHNTRTYVWDLKSLDDPRQTFSYTAGVGATDHNLYIRDQYAYLANYKSGLRILDLSGIEQGEISEAGFFDTHPESDGAGFDGAWSSYPFFASGSVIVSDISRGLFVLQPLLCREPEVASGVVANGAGDNVIEIAWDASIEPGARYDVYRELGGCDAGPGELLAEGLAAPGFIDNTVSGSVEYGYRVRVVAASGRCVSGFSACTMASTQGICTAPPQFAGLDKASTPGEASCTVDLAWAAAAPSCTGPATYEVHRSDDENFVPGPETVIQQAGEALATRDFDVVSGQTYHYAVRARDTDNQAVDGNLVRRAVTPVGEVVSDAWENGAEQGESFLGSGGIVPLHVAWHVSDSVAHTGLRSYVSGYSNGDCIALTTPAIDLGSVGGSVLSFQHRYGIESGWDGGRVEISTDALQWQSLTPSGRYPQQISDAGNACGWPVGTGVYSGSSLEWHLQSVDLTSFSGEVYLRWVFSTDGAVSDEGWWIDTITVSPAQVEGSCSTVVPTTDVSITAIDPAPSVVGSTVTVSFAINQFPLSAEPPAGRVIVTADEGSQSCTALLPASSCELALSEAGLRTVTAFHPGGGGYPGAETSLDHRVVAIPVVTVEAVSMSPSLADTAVEFVIDVRGVDSLATPTGTVVVSSDREQASCSIELPETACSLVLQAAVTHGLEAVYSGDALYQEATGTTQHIVYRSLHVFGDGFEPIEETLAR